jgi:hypothetical protein
MSYTVESAVSAIDADLIEAVVNLKPIKGGTSDERAD